VARRSITRWFWGHHPDSPRWEHTFGDQTLTQINSIVEIDLQDKDGCSPDGCQANEGWTIPTKMLGPLVTTRVEEGSDLSRERVETGDVWSFVVIARKAGQTKIARPCWASVLLGDDVIDFEGQIRVVDHRQLAVFATLVRTPPNEFRQFASHEGSMCRHGQSRFAGFEEATRLGLHEGKHVANFLVVVNLFSLSIRQDSLLRFGRQQPHPLLVVCREAKLKDVLGGGDSQSRLIGIEHSAENRHFAGSRVGRLHGLPPTDRLPIRSLSHRAIGSTPEW